MTIAPRLTVVFMLGTSVGLTGLLAKDTSGATGLPSALGWDDYLPGKRRRGGTAVGKAARQTSSGMRRGRAPIAPAVLPPSSGSVEGTA